MRKITSNLRDRSNEAESPFLMDIAQLGLRISLAVIYFWAIMDRLGWLGTAQSGKVAWGNWASFAAYTHSLLPFLNDNLANIAAVSSTAIEILLGVLLIVGFRLRWVAIGSALLTTLFALSMAVFLGGRAPLNYPVIVFIPASLLLASLPAYRWSLDAVMAEHHATERGRIG
jgi:uncharacterized membrane protein YphA (DoxX/SURF4 family)